MKKEEQMRNDKKSGTEVFTFLRFWHYGMRHQRMQSTTGISRVKSGQFLKAYIVIIVAIASVPVALKGQFGNDNFMNANTNPAFIILGISTSDIVKPGKLSDVTTSIQNATNEFNVLPESYGLEIKPAGFFKSGLTQKDLTSVNTWRNITISAGFTNENFSPDIEYPRLGFGINIPICDSIANKAQINQKFNLARESAERIRALSTEIKNKQRAFKAQRDQVSFDISVEREQLNMEVLAMEEEITRLTMKVQEDLKDVKSLTAAFFLNLSGGMVYGLPDKSWSGTSLTHGALWITGGWEFSNIQKTKFSGLFVLKAQKAYDEIVGMEDDAPVTMDINSYDLGVKGHLLGGNEKKFELSGEYIRRMRSDDLEDTDRFVVNFGYDIKKDFRVGLTLGKDFDNVMTKEGNLLSMFNFIKGFGDKPNAQ